MSLTFETILGFTYYEPSKAESEKHKEDKSKRLYLQGIEDNLKLALKHYGSDWTIRVYYQVSSNNSDVMRKLCDLTCAYPNLDLCEAQNNPRLGNATLLYPLIWRFLPAIDVNVDLYLSRDLDSRINEREVRFLQKFWENSAFLFKFAGSCSTRIPQIR